MKEGAKMMRPVLTAAEYRNLRNNTLQKTIVASVRKGRYEMKSGLVQMNYSCLPNDDGSLKGAKRMSNTVGMDIDHLPEGEMKKVMDCILAKKDELGLLMLELSARARGYHLVFKRRPELSQEENLRWASDLLGVDYDRGAKDITRVFFTTTASPEDLIFLSDELFRPSSQQTHHQPILRRKWELAPFCGAGETFSLSSKDPSRPCREGNSPGTKETAPSPKGEGENSQAQNIPVPTREGEGKGLCFRGIPYSSIIARYWEETGGVPQEGERNVRLYQLAANLRSICDNRRDLLMQVMPRLGLDEGELRSIVDSACKEPPKGISKMMQNILEMENDKVPSLPLGPKGRLTLQEGRAGGGSDIDSSLWTWGEKIEALFDEFSILRDVTKGLKRNQFTAALFVAGGLLMTLMTRCTYRFYHRREKLRRLNNSTLIIGDPASGKSFATRLYELLAAPIIASDEAGKAAINAYREQMRTKGANKDKPQKPKVIVRVHPARTSNAQFIQDMVNAVEEVDGEKMQLHMLTFDTELDNTLSLQKGGAYIDKQALQLKAFHNEEDGQAYSNVDSVFQSFSVIWNFIYTGTPIALKKMVNSQNFGSGLATRLTCIPLPPTDFQMMDWEEDVDLDSDRRLSEWAARLDRMKGELKVQRLVRELYDWTERRMADAKDNGSRADEMLLKRCAYHGLNFALPFIVMRHWASMKQDGTMWCGEFETDEVDWQLAELICNIQYACQRHYFGKMAEKYFEDKEKEACVNVLRRQRTIEAFNRLPQEFTTEDVMRCFNIKNATSAGTRICRLTKDCLVEKVGDFVENGTTKSRYRKTAVSML